MLNTNDVDQAALRESISKEVKSDREHGRKSVLDRRLIDTRHDELFSLLDAAEPLLEVAAPKRLPLYRVDLNERYAAVRQTAKAYDAAPRGTQRYSDETRDLALEAFEVVSEIRELLKERLGYSNIADGIRADCGVGAALNRNAPHDILEVGQRQIASISNPSTRELMESREIAVDRILLRLKEKVGVLDTSIQAGVGSTVTRGSAADMLDEALLGTEILLSRVVTFCKEYGAKDVGNQLSDRIPYKAAKHIKTSEELEIEAAVQKKKDADQAKADAEKKAKADAEKEAEKQAKIDAALAKK